MKKKYPRILTFAIFVIITALVWIISDVAHSVFYTKPAVVVPDEVLAPINPQIDTTALNQIQNAIYFDPNQTVNINVVPTETPQASVSPSINPSPLESPTPSSTASASPSP